MIEPRPKQLIPLWLGGNSEMAMMRAVQLADGWQPSIAPSEAARRLAVAGYRRGCLVAYFS